MINGDGEISDSIRKTRGGRRSPKAHRINACSHHHRLESMIGPAERVPVWLSGAREHRSSVLKG